MNILKKLLLLFIFLAFYPSLSHSIPLYSPEWGFYIDLPEDYVYTDGNGYDRFSFENTLGAVFDMIIYHQGEGSPGYYPSLEAMVQDVLIRLNNRGMVDFFIYRQNEIWIAELVFNLSGTGGSVLPMTGWALFMHLEALDNGPAPMLAALAYNTADELNLQILHLSALDSIIPRERDRLSPGLITEFAYPRENPVSVEIYGLNTQAFFFLEDADAAQALVDREFQVLTLYVDSPYWMEAWMRFYRAIYRDSYERLEDIAFQITDYLNANLSQREFAEILLNWIQSFHYERNFQGSDFVNLVSAAIEGRGDCDSRAMLWALILNKSGIPANIMVSRHYSHAMGLVYLPGEGARIELNGQSFLVAETTADVGIGLIAASMSDIQHWIAIPLD